MIISWIKSRFVNHKYLPTRMSSTGGQYYRCIKCGRKLYVPLDWSYWIDIKRVKGCKR